jgi:hypothetical protein
MSRRNARGMWFSINAKKLTSSGAPWGSADASGSALPGAPIGSRFAHRGLGINRPIRLMAL